MNLTVMRTSCSELTSTVNVDNIDYKEKAEQLECMAQEQNKASNPGVHADFLFFSFQLDEFVSRTSCHHSCEHVLLLIKKNINNKTMFLKRKRFLSSFFFIGRIGWTLDIHHHYFFQLNSH